MFDEFDFNILNDPDFKEDAVREEIILPIIKGLGYTLSGNSKIVRSKSLIHPYVAIGSKQRKVSIIPDYVFYSDGKPFWILDAKSPIEDIVKSVHVEQAYSYAIHPEIRASLYALCNGHELSLFDIRKFEPLLHFKIKDISKYWDSLYRILNPQVKANPALLEYHPDYGLFIKRSGASNDFRLLAFAVQANFIAKVADNQYVISAVIPGDVESLASFYFDEYRYNQLLSLQNPETSAIVFDGLRQMPYYVSLEETHLLMFGVNSIISREIIDNDEESYVPFIVEEFTEHIYLKMAPLLDEDEDEDEII